MSAGGLERAVFSLPELDLEITHVRGAEELSRLYRYQLVGRFVEGNAPRCRELVDLPGRLVLSDRFGNRRVVTGIVGRADVRMFDTEVRSFTIELVPDLHRMTRGRGARTFRDATVLEVVSAILSRARVPFRVETEGVYEARPYWAQLGETDFDYASRILADEGIFFRFDHDEEGSILVLCDRAGAARGIEGEAITFAVETGARAPVEAVVELGSNASLVAGGHSARSADWRRPALDVETTAEPSPFEVYDAPGAGPTTPEGLARFVRLASEAGIAERWALSGRTTSVRFAPGRHVRILNTPGLSFDGRYYLTRVETRVSQRDHAGPVNYHAAFRAIPEGVPYRCPPARRTTTKSTQLALPQPVELDAEERFEESSQEVSVTRPRRAEPLEPDTPPVPPGCQLGEVIGDGEIDPDTDARVRVRPLWDRSDADPQDSGTWMRVVQRCTTDSLQVPRVGWRVITLYEEGDLAAPYVFRRILDGTHPPAYPLPANATRVVYKTPTSLEDGTHNEIMFEDKKGSEEMFLGASRDMNVLVLHQKAEVIGKDHTRKVGEDFNLAVKKTYEETVARDQVLRIGEVETHDAAKGFEKRIGGQETTKVVGSRSLSVGERHDTEVQGHRSLVVTGSVEETAAGPIGATAADFTVSTGGSSYRIVGERISVDAGDVASERILGNAAEIALGDHNLNVSKPADEYTGKSELAIVGGKYTEIADESLIYRVDGDYSATAPKLLLKANKLLRLTCGATRVVMTKDTIVVTSPEIDLDGKDLKIVADKKFWGNT